MTLDELGQLVGAARRPADVFGTLTGDAATALRRRYRGLAALAHPDANPGRASLAQPIFTALQGWYAAAQADLARGAYGRPPLISAVSGGRRYEGFAPPLAGELCELYPVTLDGEALLLKVARSHRSTDLLTAEATALGRLARALASHPLRAHFPHLRESFLLADAAGVRRQVNVLATEADTLSLAEVLQRMPQGLDPADAAWIFNRILAALGVTHGCGLVHGAVLLDHLLIRPADHNAVLIDWCYSVPAGQPLKARSMAYAADYPPEVPAKQPATPATDIYLAARTMVRLLGASSLASLPAHVPPALRVFLQACLLPAPARRPTDAWQLFDEFQQILRDHYGPPRFRAFPLRA